ncbi:hypothetical protein RUM44_012749 [Polyplax serrata]|uniref:Uncharacterized protein n=1 Tax=Polyplax serrata TaxID=468196 RepID=A0ABR1BE92_POLSC
MARMKALQNQSNLEKNKRVVVVSGRWGQEQGQGFGQSIWRSNSKRKTFLGNFVNLVCVLFLPTAAAPPPPPPFCACCATRPLKKGTVEEGSREDVGWRVTFSKPLLMTRYFHLFHTNSTYSNPLDRPLINVLR